MRLVVGRSTDAVGILGKLSDFGTEFGLRNSNPDSSKQQIGIVRHIHLLQSARLKCDFLILPFHL